MNKKKKVNTDLTKSAGSHENKAPKAPADPLKEKTNQAIVRLNKAIKKLEGEDSEAAAAEFRASLEDAYIYNVSALVPMDIQDLKRPYALYPINESRSAYIACTDVQETRNPVFKQGTTFVTWRHMIKLAARDGARDGIVVNPFQSSPTGKMITLTKETLRLILLRAEGKMQAEQKEITVELMKKEQEWLSDRLELMVNCFDYDYSRETLIKIYQEFADAYVYNLKCSVPMTRKGTQLHYLMSQVSETGGAYMAYTLYEDPADCIGETLINMSWRDILTHAEQNVNCEGLVINPYHKTKHGGTLLLNRKVLRDIINHALHAIVELPDNVRDVVIKGL